MALTLNTYQAMLSRITGNKVFKTNPQKLIRVWQFPGKTAPHAGQFYSQKFLPNGNFQRRIVTVYGNNALGFETQLFNRDNKLIKSYVGARNANGTINYVSGSADEVQPLLSNYKKLNPDMRTLDDYM